MRCLNEHIARIANVEDECTGRFWEGRFKSQALLDEQALLTAMAYVDLNPVRAGLAESIETSAYTSGQQRLRDITSTTAAPPLNRPSLLPFTQALRAEDDGALPFNLQDYLELLDSTGRSVHLGKQGFIPASTPRLLTTLGLVHDEWLKTVAALHARFRLFIGAPLRLRQLAQARGWRWVCGQSAAQRLYRRVNE